MKTIVLTPGKYTFKDNVFTMSEKDILFATTYKVVNPKTNGSIIFNFTHSTGPEFHKDTKWVYVAEQFPHLSLEVCNDANMVKQAAENYFKAKVFKQHI